MGQRQNKSPTICERYAEFLLGIEDKIAPQNSDDNAYISFNDNGEVKQIRNAQYKDTGESLKLDNLNAELFQKNQNDQNSLRTILLRNDGSISGYNLNRNSDESNPILRSLFGSDRILKIIDCDTDKNCTCTFSQPPLLEKVKSITMRAATKTG